MTDSLISLYPDSSFPRENIITPRAIYLITIMGDFKGNWLDWNSDITLATFWKEPFGRKHAECKSLFNVEKKKKPNPILLTEAFSFYIYMCVCIYVYMRLFIIFIIFIGLFPVKDFSSSFSFPLYLPHIKVILSKNYTVRNPAVLPSVRFFSSFFFTGSFLSNNSLVSVREKTVCPWFGS